MLEKQKLQHVPYETNQNLLCAYYLCLAHSLKYVGLFLGHCLEFYLGCSLWTLTGTAVCEKRPLHAHALCAKWGPQICIWNYMFGGPTSHTENTYVSPLWTFEVPQSYSNVSHSHRRWCMVAEEMFSSTWRKVENACLAKNLFVCSSPLWGNCGWGVIWQTTATFDANFHRQWDATR